MNFKLSAKAVLLMSLFSVLLVPFQNCSKVQFAQVDPAVEQASSASSISDIPQDRLPASVNMPVPECKFNGIRVPEGQSRTAFQNSKVPFQKVCMSEERTCMNGILSGSFNFSSCSTDQPASCLFNGTTYKHDEIVRAFQVSNVAFGASCTSEDRVCQDGKLSGSFNFGSCEVGAPAACLFDGKTINHDEPTTAFRNSAVVFGELCVSETRLCKNGQLSGSFNFGSCEVGKPRSCLFNGTTIAHGESANAFVSSAVGFGKECISENRICSNGALSGSNEFASCEVAKPAMCLFNGVTIAHGQPVTAFVSSTAAFGETCKSESRTCSNGALSGTAQFASCEVDKPAMCLFNGKTIAHGETVTGYATSSVPFGSVCAQQNRSCNNGILSGQNQFSSCVVKAPIQKSASATSAMCTDHYIEYQFKAVGDQLELWSWGRGRDTGAIGWNCNGQGPVKIWSIKRTNTFIPAVSISGTASGAGCYAGPLNFSGYGVFRTPAFCPVSGPQTINSAFTVVYED